MNFSKYTKNGQSILASASLVLYKILVSLSVYLCLKKGACVCIFGGCNSKAWFTRVKETQTQAQAMFTHQIQAQDNRNLFIFLRLLYIGSHVIVLVLALHV